MILTACIGVELDLGLTFPDPYSLATGAPSDININTTTGRVTFTNVGTYVFTVTNGETSQQFIVNAIDCTPTLWQSEFIYCTGSGTVTQQLYLSDGSIGSGWTHGTLPAGVTLSGTGLLTINTATATAGVATVSQGGNDYTIVIGVAACPTPTTQPTTQCEVEPLGIVWVNQRGGRQSFWFNQVKEYGVKQAGGVTYINANLEKRYATRGRVEDRVSIVQEYVTAEQLESLQSLLDSIQAWVCGDIANANTYRSIIIDEQTYTVRRTNDRFFTVSFDFSYSIERNIQRQ
jgi:hypothetical protein